MAGGQFVILPSAMKDTKSNIALKYCAGRYRITGDGKLFRPDGSEMIPSLNRAGYPHFGVQVRRMGIDQKVLIHRIVAYQKYGEAVLVRGVVCRHLNGNKTDFSPANIRIGTARENHDDNDPGIRTAILEAARLAAKKRRLFTDSQVREIRQRNSDGEGYQKLANNLGCSKATICGIVRRRFYCEVE